ncbi:hypothetical protein [Luteibacter rhizovicinus]|uniref:hypothetical protein n=1 Tax=Luteibacter rhizovicinus TaxID=242606 RepID=UPI003D18DE75
MFHQPCSRSGCHRGVATRREYNGERPKRALRGLTPSAYFRRLAAETITITARLRSEALLRTG